MGSLRYRFLPPTGAGVAGDTGGDPFRLPRDPATDQATPAELVTVGLAGNPAPPIVLGRQVKTTDPDDTVRPAERSLDTEERGTLAPGTIRRNVSYEVNGARGQGFFSWASNAIGEALGFVPARPPQDEYLVSSLFLGLPDSLATVVSGTVKTAPGLEPFRQRPTIQAQPSTGWPVEAPVIPSYGSRVPLRRPRGLVSVDSG